MDLGSNLSDRAAAVLKAVVENYVKVSSPVSSQSIAALPGFGLSPASIRNVMAELDEEGFLIQPHTSAGRVPSDKGYRYYAQDLVGLRALPEDHKSGIRSAVLDDDAVELESLLRSVSRTLSALSRNASVVGLRALGFSPIKRVQFINVNDGLVLAVLVTMGGEIRKHVIRVNTPYSAESLERMTNYFNDRFSCLNLGQVRRLLGKEIRSDRREAGGLLDSAFEMASAMEAKEYEEYSDKVYVDGAANLLGGGDERGSVGKVKALFRALDEKAGLLALLDGCLNSGGVSLTIGAESEMEELFDYTLVAHPFSGGDGSKGALGIIGGKRMNYAGNIALVAYAADAVSRRLAGRGAEEPL